MEAEMLGHITIEEWWIVASAACAGFALGAMYALGAFVERRRSRLDRVNE
jgi:hypothetical protein